MPSATVTRAGRAWVLGFGLVAAQIAAADATPSGEGLSARVNLATHTVVTAAARRPLEGVAVRPNAGQSAALSNQARRPSQSLCSGPDDRALSAVLPIATDKGSHASGVVFAQNQVLTAAHAVQGASRFFVRTGADFRRANLISVDHDSDLAVLAIDTGDIQPLPLSRGALALSEPVWAVGFPRASGLTTSSGVFQRLDGGAVHTSASIDSGQSGGGLLRCHRGRYAIAGMLRGYGAYRSGDGFVKLRNHSVSVAAGTIRRFLQSTTQHAW